MATCAFESCNSENTNRLRIKGHKDKLDRNVQILVTLCDECKDLISGKKLDYTYYRCGNLIFVEEIMSNEKQLAFF